MIKCFIYVLSEYGSLSLSLVAPRAAIVSVAAQITENAKIGNAKTRFEIVFNDVESAKRVRDLLDNEPIDDGTGTIRVVPGMQELSPAAFFSDSSSHEKVVCMLLRMMRLADLRL